MRLCFSAATLYHAGKVRRLLASGDKHMKGYDEATDMRDALVAAKVRAEAIGLDYAGFRILDWVARVKEVFGQTRLTIISEPVHNYRALFICRKYGINVVAFNARPESLRVSRWPSIRER
jgi:SanA protein